jgi:hypothetical protein
VVNGTTITANAPGGTAGSAPVVVTVTNADGQSATQTFAFTYNVGPTLSTLSPPVGKAVGTTVLTIKGTFDASASATVTVGGVSAGSVSVVNGTTITANAPGGTAGSAPVVVTVTNADGQSATQTFAFTYKTVPTTCASGEYYDDPTIACILVPSITICYTVKKSSANKDYAVFTDYGLSGAALNVVSSPGTKQSPLLARYSAPNNTSTPNPVSISFTFTVPYTLNGSKVGNGTGTLQVTRTSSGSSTPSRIACP